MAAGMKRMVLAVSLGLTACPSTLEPPDVPTDGGTLDAADTGRDTGSDAGVAIGAHCAPGPECPELIIEGDPLVAWPTHPFHGLGDPSLEADGDVVWLSYSWLDTFVTPPDLVDFRVVTHLARSDDGGRTFRFVRAVNVAEERGHWDDPSRRGFLEHEVSTLVRRADGFELVDLAYFDPFGLASENRTDFFLERTVAASAEGLGDVVEPMLRSDFTTPSVGGLLVNALPGLEDCGLLTEPALFRQGDQTYLAANCLAFEGLTRRVDLDRSVLLREDAGGFTPLGVLLDADDAAALGGDQFEQLDLSVARDGTTILIGTPIRMGEDPAHQGCVVLEMEDVPGARVRRDADGRPHVRTRITVEGNGLGPGLCTYDAASETGVLTVSTHFDLGATPPNIDFRIHATHFHP